MAYMNQEKKAIIAAALKKVMPKDWKYSLRCDRYSITCTISAAPVDLIKLNAGDHYDTANGYLQLNKYYMHQWCTDKAVADALVAIRTAMDTGNWDRSDIMTDYFDVGHYVHIHVGRWDKPFVCTAKVAA